MLFSLLKHYLELYITDTAPKVSRSLCCFTISISHGVKNFFPRLWGMAFLMLILNFATNQKISITRLANVTESQTVYHLIAKD